MKPPQRIPTIIGLLLLIVGLGSTVFLVEQGERLLIQADTHLNPQEIAITNISDTAFSVSWITNKPTRGIVSYAQAGDTATLAFDDRDETAPQKYLTHHVSVRNLEPNTTYTFTILSDNKTYDNAGAAFQLQTGRSLSKETYSPPIYGTVSNANDQPGSGVLIYFTANNSQMLSAVADNAGQFVLPIAQLRDQSLTQSIALSNNDTVELTMREGNNAITQVIATVENTRPLPTIVLGRLYDFVNLKSIHRSSLAYTWRHLKNLFRAVFLSPAYASATISITQPAPGSGVPSRTPLFKGTGVVGKQVITTVGTPPQTGKVWIGKEGTWSWTPPEPLLPDTYILTVTTFDEQNKAVALSRQFTVLKSGSSVLQAATPSATPTTSATPIPIITASPSAQPLPVSGSTGPTVAVVFAGLVLLFTGSAAIATIKIKR